MDPLRIASLFFKTLILMTKYSYFLKTKSLNFCLNQCRKKSALKNLEEIQFVDRTSRRVLRYLKPQSPCLVHSLTLAQMTPKNAKIYLQIPVNHAYVECFNQKFSTSLLKNDNNDLLIWSKEQDHAFL